MTCRRYRIDDEGAYFEVILIEDGKQAGVVLVDVTRGVDEAFCDAIAIGDLYVSRYIAQR